MKKYSLILGIISLLLVSACSQQTEPVQPAPQPKAVIEPADEPSERIQAGMPVPGQEGEVEEHVVEPAEETAPSVVEIDMTARQWAFEPSTITVNEGDTVRLNIKSEDVTHGFALSEFDVNEKILPGKTTTIEFVADKKGEYTFFCSVPCGAGHGGMRGKLIVE